VAARLRSRGVRGRSHADSTRHPLTGERQSIQPAVIDTPVVVDDKRGVRRKTTGRRTSSTHCQVGERAHNTNRPRRTSTIPACTTYYYGTHARAGAVGRGRWDRFAGWYAATRADDGFNR